MKNVNIEELVQNVPTMDLAKALVTSFLQNHSHTIEKEEGEAAYHLAIWAHDLDFMEEPQLSVEAYVKDKGFTTISVDWSEFRELSKRANESL